MPFCRCQGKAGSSMDKKRQYKVIGKCMKQGSAVAFLCMDNNGVYEIADRSLLAYMCGLGIIENLSAQLHESYVIFRGIEDVQEQSLEGMLEKTKSTAGKNDTESSTEEKKADTSAIVTQLAVNLEQIGGNEFIPKMMSGLPNWFKTELWADGNDKGSSPIMIWRCSKEGEHVNLELEFNGHEKKLKIDPEWDDSRMTEAIRRLYNSVVKEIVALPEDSGVSLCKKALKMLSSTHGFIWSEKSSSDIQKVTVKAEGNNSTWLMAGSSDGVVLKVSAETKKQPVKLEVNEGEHKDIVSKVFEKLYGST